MRRWDSRWCWALLLSAGCAARSAPAPADPPREPAPVASPSASAVPAKPPATPPRAATPAASPPAPEAPPEAAAHPPELRPLRSDEAEVDLRVRTEAAIREAREGLDDADEPLDPTVAGLVGDLLEDSRRALQAGDLDRAHALAVKAATLAAGR